MQFFTLLILTVLAVFFVSPSQAAHSEQDIEALMNLQDQVNDFLGGSNMSPEAKAQIEAMMAKKQKEVEAGFHGKRK